MASHDDSGKKSSENEVPTFNAENLQSNMKVVYYSRTFMSIIGGVIAGILGVTGLMGFVVYLLVMAITSVCLTARAGFSIHSYFDSWNRVLLDGFLGGLLSFVLFWTYPFILAHFLYRTHPVQVYFGPCFLRLEVAISTHLPQMGRICLTFVFSLQ